jgi:uncharacterized protein (TIRG00374 family)
MRELGQEYGEKALQLILSGIILLFVFKFVDLELLVIYVKDIGVVYLLLGILLLPLGFLIRAYRWSAILNQPSDLISPKDLFLLTFVGVSLSFVLPASLGDLARAYYGYKHSGLKEEMLSSSLVDKIMGLLAIVALGTVSSLLHELYAYSLVCLLLMIVFVVLIFFPTLIPWKLVTKAMRSVTRSSMDAQRLLESFTLSNGVKLLTLTLSVLAWFVTYMQFYLICLALTVNVPLTYVFAMAPMITIARLFPLTLNGFGSQEAVVIYLFGLVDVSPNEALLVSLLYSFVQLVIPGLVGLLVIAREGLLSGQSPNSSFLDEKLKGGEKGPRLRG